MVSADHHDVLMIGTGQFLGHVFFLAPDESEHHVRSRYKFMQEA
jgi:hypothetical protein